MPFGFGRSKKAAAAGTVAPAAAAAAEPTQDEQDNAEIARQFQEKTEEVRRLIKEHEKEGEATYDEARANAAAFAETLAKMDKFFVHDYKVTISWSRVLGAIWAITWTVLAFINSGLFDDSEDDSDIAGTITDQVVEHVCEQTSCSLAVGIQWAILALLAWMIGRDFTVPISDLSLPDPPKEKITIPPNATRKYVEWPGNGGRFERGKIYKVRELPLKDREEHGIPEEEILEEYVKFATELKRRNRFRGRIFESRAGQVAPTFAEFVDDLIRPLIEEKHQEEQRLKKEVPAYQIKVDKLREQHLARVEWWAAFNKRLHTVTWFVQTLIALGLMTAFPIITSRDICTDTLIPFCGFPGFLFGSTTFTLCTYVIVIRTVWAPEILEEVLLTGTQIRAHADSAYAKGRRPSGVSS
ncbi:Hypothetical Protein FCC1311_065942 [Hondaea fermentalgiana]|uniref:Uncharacterized protein n=1 Tax=Hondaea fermentalgiana TaxID=2315210 RepID=A0A2R5GIF3_9STRA|nr:Hypothetical Protein FCC1311_065942 [Hondaea fermentalgiana]|eukprot:GBG30375.1 Hypothetical Protein FCC1311_065942 [Hondaea fermentalgiana]